MPQPRTLERAYAAAPSLSTERFAPPSSWIGGGCQSRLSRRGWPIRKEMASFDDKGITWTQHPLNLGEKLLHVWRILIVVRHDPERPLNRVEQFVGERLKRVPDHRVLS